MRNQGKFKKMLEENPGTSILTDNPERMKERIRSAGLDPDDYTIVDANEPVTNTNPANLVEACKRQMDQWMMQTVRKVPYLFEEQDQPKNNQPIVYGTPIPGDYDQKLDRIYGDEIVAGLDPALLDNPIYYFDITTGEVKEYGEE